MITVAVVFHKNSEVNTVRRLKRNAEKFGYCFLELDQRNNNQSALVGRKRLIEKCNTEYIWLVDGDDSINQLDFIPECDIERLETSAHVPLVSDVNQNPCMWTRIVKTELAKEAITHYPDMFALAGEDTLLAYWCEELANSSNNHPDKIYYNYNASSSSCGLFYIQDPDVFIEVYSYPEVYKYLPKEHWDRRNQTIALSLAQCPNREYVKKILASNIINQDVLNEYKLLKDCFRYRR